MIAAAFVGIPALATLLGTGGLVVAAAIRPGGTGPHHRCPSRAWPTRACATTTTAAARSCQRDRDPGAARSPTVPAATSNGRRMGAPSGVQPAHRRPGGPGPGCRSAPRPAGHWIGPIEVASSAMMTAARSRIRRERSRAANALVTARLATHAQRRPSDARRPAATTAGERAEAEPAATTRPHGGQQGGSGRHADERGGQHAPRQRRRRSGSSANRAGSSVSSTPKKSSGTRVQPSTTTRRRRPPPRSRRPASAAPLTARPKAPPRRTQARTATRPRTRSPATSGPGNRCAAGAA